MNFISTQRRVLLPLFGVMAAFVISRIVYDAAGIRFQGDTYLSYWQFIDPVLLQNDLWQSVYYLHSQPPLMNLLTGLVLQGFPDQHQQVFHILYFLSGLILATSLYGLGIYLRFPPWLSAILSGLFIMSPGAVLYEHWLNYTHPLAAILTLTGLLLYKFVETRKSIWGASFFFCLAVMALTWSLFHIAWLFGLIILFLVLFPDRKKLALAALLPAILVTGWYAKNLVLVDEFTASSWAGMNISKIATFRLPEKERRQMVKSGELSKFALILPFRNPSAYLKLLPHTPITGIPVWDEPETSQHLRNHHHLVYVEASEYYLRDALQVIHSRPHSYAGSILQAFYIYFHSSSDFDLISQNRDRIRVFDTWWNRLFYGQLQSNETSIDRNASMSAANVAWWIVLSFFSVAIGGIHLLWKRRSQLAQPENMLVLFMIYNILFVTLVGNLMDIGENNRFRFVVDPFLLTLFVVVLRVATPNLPLWDTREDLG